MTHITVGRDIQRQVIRIDTLIVVRLVTGHAGVRQIIIVTLVAGIAIYGSMLAC